MSIVIGALSTALQVSLSINRDSSQKKSKKHRRHKVFNLCVKWKGVNSMTLLFATLLASVGIPERDSKMC